MSRVEELQGYRWAKDVCLSARQAVKGWKAALILALERGLVEKPEGYKVGVMKMIDIVRSVEDEEGREGTPE